MNIQYKEFEKHLNNIKRLMSFEDSLRSICNQAYHDNLDCEIHFPTLIGDVIDLLVNATDDRNEWIEYWVYELDCGENYEDGMITDANKNIIKLKTVEDLWNCIQGNI